MLETTGDLRVRLVHDPDPCNPRTEFNQLAHVVTVPHRQYADVDKDGGPLTDGWQRLLDRYPVNSAVAMFERWARIFHSASTLHDAPHEGAVAVWYLLPAEIEREGITDPLRCLDGEREEYRAWAEGDVHGYVIEERVTWVPADPIRHPLGSLDTWVQVDSCWGFYGHGYAEDEARAAFAEHTGSVNDDE